MQPPIPSKPSVRLTVIGGGAAGFFGAIHARLANPGLRITILEAAPKPLGKVKISGGGRCNVTHACFDNAQLVKNYPRGEKALRGIFSRFSTQDTVQWFESRGVTLKTEADGRMFPVTDDSQTIIDCLRSEANRLGIELITRQPVQSILYKNGQFDVLGSDQTWTSEALLLATGSNPKGYQWLKDLGHNLIPPVPSLFTFKIKDKRFQDLAGTSFQQVKATLKTSDGASFIQESPMLITHWGLSGPAILRLSAWGARALFGANYQATLLIDFFPSQKEDQLQQWFLRQKQDQAKKQIGNVQPEGLTRRFWENWLACEGIAPDSILGELPNKPLNKLANGLKRAEFHVNGKGEFKDEFVTAGGLALNEIDLKTMQSKKIPGLFVAGEIIDIDGITGGFNFQNAWSTAYIAGESLSSRLLEI